MLKFTETYYDDAERFALYLSATTGDDVELVYDDSDGFPMPPKGMCFDPQVSCFKVGGIEIAYLKKRKSPLEDLKHRNRTLYRYVMGQSLREARERAGMSLDDIAEKTGLKASNIRNVELGRYNADMDVMGNLLEAMDCHFEIKSNKK